MSSDSHPSGDKKEKDNKSWAVRTKNFIVVNILVLLTFLAVILALSIGMAIRKTKFSKDSLRYLDFPGRMFLRMMMVLIAPLVTSSIIASLANIHPRIVGRIGLKAVIYYLVTTAISVCLGIFLVMTIKPGKVDRSSGVVQQQTVIEGQDKLKAADTVIDLMYNLCPDNLITATFQQYQTIKTKIPRDPTKLDIADDILINTTQNISKDTDEWIAIGKKRDGVNVLGLVVFSLIIGVILGQLGDDAKCLVQVIAAVNELFMRLVAFVMWYSPIGIFFLILVKLLELDDLKSVFMLVGKYVGTVILGLFIHSCINLPIIYTVITKKNPAKFCADMSQALATAFGTASSSATLPVTFKCLEQRSEIDRAVTRFILPIGATMNMDGTALYEAVAAIFIAQLNNIPLSFASIITISLTSTLASIGAAGVPQGGLVTMVVVLNAADLPTTDISLIYAVDWICDRFRTMVNVWGDAIGAAILDRLCKNLLLNEKQLKKLEEQALPIVGSSKGSKVPKDIEKNLSVANVDTAV
ncbi:hypothetical protein SNEBB_007026 [Seison nebaliae]|nr:hypothetical protein SNEBB_007026 [Seison nebaliae]